MMDILKRMEEENSREDPEQAVEGEEETLSLEERMGGLNLGEWILFVYCESHFCFLFSQVFRPAQ